MKNDTEIITSNVLCTICYDCPRLGKLQSFLKIDEKELIFCYLSVMFKAFLNMPLSL